MAEKKADPKDERIAELELANEELENQLREATSRAQATTALTAEIAKLQTELVDKGSELSKLKGEVQAMKEASGSGGKATVAGLDPAKAIQLKVSRTTTDALTGARVDASAGDVLAIKDAFIEVQKRVGVAAAVYPVDASELGAAKKAGHTY